MSEREGISDGETEDREVEEQGTDAKEDDGITWALYERQRPEREFQQRRV